MDTELKQICNQHLNKRQQILNSIIKYSETSDTEKLVQLCKEAAYHMIQATFAKKLIGVVPD